MFGFKGFRVVLLSLNPKPKPGKLDQLSLSAFVLLWLRMFFWGRGLFACRYTIKLAASPEYPCNQIAYTWAFK